MLLLSLFAPPSVVSLRSTEQLNRIANRAIKVGRHQDALKCYETALTSGSDPCRTPLLHALHLQRMQRPSAQVRAAFSQGAFIDRGNPRLLAELLIAWGLFESKQAEMGRAVRLLRRAVHLDASKSDVLRWRMFRTALDAQQRGDRERAGARAPPRVAATMEAEAPPAIAVRRPPVRYTVPIQNLGWRGRPERGEDPAKWYDAQGVREGPPRNYWRQSLDERTHRAEMRVIDVLVGGGSGDELREACEELEYRMGIKAPQRHRKLLGPWAPLATSGARIATAGDGGGLRAPALVIVRRDGAARTYENRYGEFDANLDAGEAVAFELRDCEGRTAVTVEAAAADNERRLVVGADAAEWSADGSITYLSDYLLIQRRDRDDGETPRDVWVRVVDGDPSAPVYPY